MLCTKQSLNFAIAFGYPVTVDMTCQVLLPLRTFCLLLMVVLSLKTKGKEAVAQVSTSILVVSAQKKTKQL